MKKQRKKSSGPHGSVPDLDFRERLGTLRNLPEFFRLIWNCNQWLTTLNMLLRVVRASLPLIMLYLAKLIIDEIVLISGVGSGVRVENPDMSILTILVLAELGFAVFSDLLGRGIALVDSLLGDLVSHDISIRLMNQSAKLDLECFEDSEFYDKLERARRQASSRILLSTEYLPLRESRGYVKNYINSL